MTTPSFAPIAVHAGAGDLTSYSNSFSFGPTLAKPANVADGDVLVAFIFGQNASTITPPSGWTQVTDHTTSAYGTRAGGVFVKPIPSAAAETATSYAWGLATQTRNVAALFRVTGAHLSAIVDVLSAGVAYSTGGGTLPSLSTTNDGDLILGFVYTNDSAAVSGQTFSDSYSNPDIGVVQTPSGNSSSIDVFYYVQSAHGATPTDDIITRNTAPANGHVYAIALNANPANVSLTAAWGSSSAMGASPSGPIAGATSMTSVSAFASTGGVSRILPTPLVTNTGDFTYTPMNVAGQFTVTGTKPTNVADGDTLIAVVVSQIALGSGDLATPTPWTRIGAATVVNNGAYRPICAYALPVPSAAALTDTSWTWTNPNATFGRMAVLIFRVRDVDPNTVQDATSLMTQGTTTFTTAAFTTTVPNDLLLLCAHDTGTSSQRPVTFTDPSGYTRQFYGDTGATGSYDGLYVATAAAATSGTSESVTLPISPAQTAYSGFLLALRGRSLAAAPSTGAWGSVSAFASAARSTAPSITPTSVTSMGFSPVATTAQAAALVSTTALNAAFLNPVQAFMRDLPMYVAHRGGDADWVQDTAYAYAHSVAWSHKLALEVSLIPTSDGFYMLSDQVTTDAVFGTTNNDIRTQTKAQLKTLRTTVGGFPPMFFDEDILPVYGGPSSTTPRVIFLDNKLSNNVTAMLNTMDANGGPAWWVCKAGGTGNSWSTPAHARGYTVWKYWFPGDTSAGNLNAGTVADCDLIGLQYNDTTTAYNLAKTFGKALLSHVISSQASATQAFGQGGVSGLMVSGIMEVVPADAATGMTSSSAMGAGANIVQGLNTAAWGSSSGFVPGGVISKSGAAALSSHTAFSASAIRVSPAPRAAMLSTTAFAVSGGVLKINSLITFRSVTAFASRIVITHPAAAAMLSRSAFAATAKRTTPATPAGMLSTTAFATAAKRTTIAGSRMTSITAFALRPQAITAAASMRSVTALHASTSRSASVLLGFTSVSHLATTPGSTRRTAYAVFISTTAFAAATKATSHPVLGMFSPTSFAVAGVLNPTAHWVSVIIWDPPINVIFLETIAWRTVSIATFFSSPVSHLRSFPLTARLASYAAAPQPLTATLAPQPFANAGDFS